jgi:hypothetical protein
MDAHCLKGGFAMKRVAWLAATVLLFVGTNSIGKAAWADGLASNGVAQSSFAQCGSGEIGVTKDGSPCWSGPIDGHFPLIHGTPEEQAQHAAERISFCDINPDTCNPSGRLTALCRQDPSACFPPAKPLSTAPPQLVQSANPAFRYEAGSHSSVINQYDLYSGTLLKSYPNPNASAVLGSSSSSAAVTSSASATPMTLSGSNFPGPSWTPGGYPMDLSMALNPSTDLLVHTNNGLYFYTIDGTPMINFDVDEVTFWCTNPTSPLPECNSLVGDTQVVFDFTSSKWIVTALSGRDTAGGGGHYLYIAVSGTDPGSGPGTWTYYYVPACSNYTPGSDIEGDKDVLGISSLKVIADVRFCNKAGATQDNPDTIYDFDRSALANGKLSYHVFNSPVDQLGDTVIRLRPAYDYESFIIPGATKSYLAGVVFNVLGSFSGSIVDVYYIKSTGAVANDELVLSNQYPVDPAAVPSSIPPGPQRGCNAQNCMIDTGFVDPESVFIQNNKNSGHKLIFTTFAVKQLGTTANNEIDVFGADITTNTPEQSIIATLVHPGNADILSFPSIAAARQDGLYMTDQDFSTSSYPLGELNYFTYYPVSSGLQLQGGDVLTSSGAMFTAAVDPTTGLHRWGDYTSAVWQLPMFPTWPQNFYFIDEFTPDGTD